MNVLVFGAGVYVKGEGGELSAPPGNLGAALVECKREGLIDEIFLVSTSASADLAAEKINTNFGSQFAFSAQLGLGSIGRFSKRKCVSVAVVALPDDLHYDYIRECGEAGLHVITVKPFVETVEQADHLIALFKSKGLLGCVEFHKRFDQANLLLRECLRRDEMISRIFVDYSQDRTVALNDFAKWISRSNTFQYLGVHYVDLIHWLTGAWPVAVRVFRSGRSLKEQGVNAEDNVDVVIGWAHGETRFNSFHLTSWAENHKNYCPSRQRIEILTNLRRYESEQAYRGFKIVDGDGVEVINPYFSKSFSINEITRFFGYGVETYLSFFRALKAQRQLSDGFDNIDDRLCTFESARCSVFVTERVCRNLHEKL